MRAHRFKYFVFSNSLSFFFTASFNKIEYEVCKTFKDLLNAKRPKKLNSNEEFKNKGLNTNGRIKLQEALGNLNKASYQIRLEKPLKLHFSKAVYYLNIS